MSALPDVVDAVSAGWNVAQRYREAMEEARRILVEERDLYKAERILAEAIKREDKRP